MTFSIDSLMEQMPCLPRRYYPGDPSWLSSLRENFHAKDQLDGELPQGTVEWYEGNRHAFGLERLRSVSEYAARRVELLSPQAGLLGKYVYAVCAEACGEAFLALPDWQETLPKDMKGLKGLPVLLECLSDFQGKVRNGCWYMAAAKHVLEHLPPPEGDRDGDVGNLLCSVGLACRGGPESVPAMLACRDEARRRGVPDTNPEMARLNLFLAGALGQ